MQPSRAEVGRKGVVTLGGRLRHENHEGIVGGYRLFKVVEHPHEGIVTGIVLIDRNHHSSVVSSASR